MLKTLSRDGSKMVWLESEYGWYLLNICCACYFIIYKKKYQGLGEHGVPGAGEHGVTGTGEHGVQGLVSTESLGYKKT